MEVTAKAIGEDGECWRCCAGRRPEWKWTPPALSYQAPSKLRNVAVDDFREIHWPDLDVWVEQHRLVDIGKAARDRDLQGLGFPDRLKITLVEGTRFGDGSSVNPLQGILVLKGKPELDELRRDAWATMRDWGNRSDGIEKLASAIRQMGMEQAIKFYPRLWWTRDPVCRDLLTRYKTAAVPALKRRASRYLRIWLGSMAFLTLTVVALALVHQRWAAEFLGVLIVIYGGITLALLLQLYRLLRLHSKET